MWEHYHQPTNLLPLEANLTRIFSILDKQFVKEVFLVLTSASL